MPRPHNYEAEQALLAAILENNAAYHIAREHVGPEHFADPVHGRIFETCGRLIERSGTADVHTLKTLFENDGALADVGGAQYLAQLAGSVVTVIGTKNYAEIIRDLADRREIISVCEDAATQAASGDYLDASAEAVAAALASKCEGIIAKRAGPVMDRRRVMIGVTEELTKPRACYSTGLRALDLAMAGGLYSGKVYGLVARKKVGKTCLAGTISYNLNEAGVRHLFVCCEMGGAAIEQRNIGRALGLNALAFLNKAERESPEFHHRVADYAIHAPSNIIYENAPGLAFADLRRLVERHVVLSGIRGIIIDYLQLIGGKQKGQSRADHLDEVTQWIAGVCGRHDIWALVLAQENREDNVRGGEGLRMACDQCYGLHREENGSAAWMEQWESRYTPYSNVGSAAAPALTMRKDAGPFFQDADPAKDAA